MMPILLQSTELNPVVGNPYIYALKQFFLLWDSIMSINFPYLFTELTFKDVIAGVGVLAICVEFYNVVFDRNR